MKNEEKKINKEVGLISKNGVCIDGDILLKCEHDHSSQPYLGLRICLALIATWSIASMANSFVGSPVRGTVLFFFSLIGSLCFGLLESKYGIVKFSAAVITLVYATDMAMNFSYIKYGFFFAVGNYMKLSGISPGSWGSYTIGLDKNDPEYFFYFFGALILVESMGVALSSIFRIDFPLLFIFTFPIFEIGMYQGMEAPTLAVVGLMVSWVTVLCMHIINHTTNRAGRKNTFAVHERSKTFFFTSNSAKSEFYTVYIGFVSIFTASVFLVIILFSSITGFVRPRSFDAARTNLHHAITSFDIANVDEFFSDLSGGANLYGVTTVGGTNGGELGTSSGISFNGVTALKIKSSKFNYTMYIKGYVAGHYENNTWVPMPDNSDTKRYVSLFDEINSFPQDYNYIVIDTATSPTASNLDIMDIKVKGACQKFIYAPYASIYSGSPDLSALGSKVSPYNDAYVRITKSETGYSVVYWNFSRNNWLGRIEDLKYAYPSLNKKTEQAFEEYEKYVKDMYLYTVDLDSLNQVYKEILDTYFDGNSMGYGYEDVYKAIKDYLGQHYTYDLQPGATPKGEDFIDYFLTKQKKGYCSYFATVGTQLLRKFGYPARYVEGYMILPSQQGDKAGSDGRYEVTVPDKCAHAWAEVFIPGIGWSPAEFTPGYDNDNPNLTPAEKKLTEQTTTTTTTRASETLSSKADVSSRSPAETTSKTASSKADSSKKTDSKTDSKKSDNSKGSGGGAGGISNSSTGDETENKLSPISKTLIVTVIGVVLIAAAVIINRRYRLKLMHQRCTQNDLNGRVMEIYKYSLKYLALLDIQVNRNLTDLQLCDEILEKCHGKKINELDDMLVELSLLAVKAQMSQSGITEEEAKKAADTMKFISEQVVGEALNDFSKISAKYLYCLY